MKDRLPPLKAGAIKRRKWWMIRAFLGFSV
jgi:hypothetical protein